VPDSAGLLRGRPYGGLASVFRDQLASSLEIKNTGTCRVHCTEMKL